MLKFLAILTISSVLAGNCDQVFGPPSYCPDEKPNNEGGLCYINCPDGYHGVGPLCWRNSGVSGKLTIDRGVGTPAIWC